MLLRYGKRWLSVCLLCAWLITLCLAFSPVVLAQDGQGPTGIQPIPPSEAVNRVDTLVGKGYHALGGVVDKLALLLFGVAAVVAAAAFITGWAFFKRTLGMLALIALGLLVFYLAPFMVGVIKGIAAHFS